MYSTRADNYAIGLAPPTTRPRTNTLPMLRSSPENKNCRAKKEKEAGWGVSHRPQMA